MLPSHNETHTIHPCTLFEKHATHMWCPVCCGRHYPCSTCHGRIANDRRELHTEDCRARKSELDELHARLSEFHTSLEVNSTDWSKAHGLHSVLWMKHTFDSGANYQYWSVNACVGKSAQQYTTSDTSLTIAHTAKLKAALSPLQICIIKIPLLAAKIGALNLGALLRLCRNLGIPQSRGLMDAWHSPIRKSTHCVKRCVMCASCGQGDLQRVHLGSVFPILRCVRFGTHHTHALRCLRCRIDVTGTVVGIV